MTALEMLQKMDKAGATVPSTIRSEVEKAFGVNQGAKFTVTRSQLRDPKFCLAYRAEIERSSMDGSLLVTEDE